MARHSDRILISLVSATADSSEIKKNTRDFGDVALHDPEDIRPIALLSSLRINFQHWYNESERQQWERAPGEVVSIGFDPILALNPKLVSGLLVQFQPFYEKRVRHMAGLCLIQKQTVIDKTGTRTLENSKCCQMWLARFIGRRSVICDKWLIWLD